MKRETNLLSRASFGSAVMASLGLLYFLSAAPALKVNDRLTTGDWIDLGKDQFPTWRLFYRPVVWTMRASPLGRPLKAWSMLWVSPSTLEHALEPAGRFHSIAEFSVVISCTFGPDEENGADDEEPAEAEMPDAEAVTR
jgi:hypothetical protein